MASVTVQVQGMSSEKLHADSTFEYVVLALTVLQMFALYGFYPASAGIPISLFALVALGVNRFVKSFRCIVSSCQCLRYDISIPGNHFGSGVSSSPHLLLSPILCSCLLRFLP
jgi:hypothetical protein